MTISKHISFLEGIRSNTAKRFGIDNTPNEYELGNMELLASRVFEPLREWVGGPIRINSFFRCKELNKKVGGSKRSQHIEGRAIDIDDTHGHKTNAEMFHYIKDNLDFDKLIAEYKGANGPEWIHVSYVSEEQNRKQVYIAVKEEGKTVYKEYSKELFDQIYG